MKAAMAGLMAVLAGAAAAAPQSLGDAAEKEKKKREAKPSASAPAARKVFTGEDLESIAATRGPEAKAVPFAPGASEDAGRLPVDESAARAAQERDWRERKRIADAELREAESRLQLAQRNRNLLGTGPTPYEDAGAWSSVAERLDAQLNEAREARARAKEALEALEEDARRAGVPPGWLR
ncbi:MAG TPA: hypothetical protein VIZ31_10465 [Vicinamibacteria bacterium]